MCNVTTACSRRVCARYVSEGSHMVPDGHISATYVHGTLYICPFGRNGRRSAYVDSDLLPREQCAG